MCAYYPSRKRIGGVCNDYNVISEQLYRVLACMDVGAATTAWQILNTTPVDKIPSSAAESIRKVIAFTYPDVDFISRCKKENVKAPAETRQGLDLTKKLYNELCVHVLEAHMDDASCTRLKCFPGERRPAVAQSGAARDVSSKVFDGGAVFCIIGAAFIEFLDDKTAGIEWIKQSKVLGSEFAVGTMKLFNREVYIPFSSAMGYYTENIRIFIKNSDRTLITDWMLFEFLYLAEVYIDVSHRRECGLRALYIADELHKRTPSARTMYLLARCYFYTGNTKVSTATAHRLFVSSYTLGNIYAATEYCSIRANDATFFERDTGGTITVSRSFLSSVGLPETFSEHIEKWSYSDATTDPRIGMTAAVAFRNYINVHPTFVDTHLHEDLILANAKDGCIASIEKLVFGLWSLVDVRFWLKKFVEIFSTDYVKVASAYYHVAVRFGDDQMYFKAADVLSRNRDQITPSVVSEVFGRNALSNTAFIRVLGLLSIAPGDIEYEMRGAETESGTVIR